MTTLESEQLLAACGHRVYQLCLRLTRSDHTAGHDADELFQETFVKACTAPLPAPPESREAYNWLYTIALNVYRKSYNKRKRVVLQQDEWWQLLPDPGLVEVQVEASEDHHMIRTLVQEMDDKYRIPILLYYWSEWDTKAIAHALHLPHATVRTRLKRGRELLARKMDSETAFDIDGRVPV